MPAELLDFTRFRMGALPSHSCFTSHDSKEIHSHTLPNYSSRGNMSKQHGAAFPAFDLKCAVKHNLPHACKECT
jgi:hypothetical protein